MNRILILVSWLTSVISAVSVGSRFNVFRSLPVPSPFPSHPVPSRLGPFPSVPYPGPDGTGRDEMGRVND